MDGVTNDGGVSVTGNQDVLTNWGDGVLMTHLGGDLWQACVRFAGGSLLPIDVEYKFRKDQNFASWEGVPNRTVTVDNSSPAEQTLPHTWDDGPGICQPIPTRTESFGTVKSRY
jgi:hypothetical protein